MSKSEPILALIKPVIATVPKKSKDILDELTASSGSVDIETGHISDEGVLLKGLIYAVQKGQQKTIIAALLAIEKLFGSSFVKCASSITSPDGSQKLLVDDIVESIANTLNSSSQTDDDIQVSVMRALISIAAVKDSAVHGPTTMTIIRACFQVNKDSKSASNQTVAQTSLNQILTTILSRLEVPSEPTSDDPQLDWYAKSVARKALDQAVAGESLCVVCRKPATLTCPVSDFPVCGEDCKTLNLQNLTHTGRSEGAAYFTDLLMVFQSLCKLSQKDTIPPGSQAPDARIIKAKRLSLELINYLLTAPGADKLSNAAPFISLVKEHLILTLFTNSVTPVQRIFSLALQITVTTFATFRPVVLSELGIFIEQVFLSIAESGNAPADHKEAVLEAFAKLCADAETVLSLFIRFDCQVDKHNIVEKAINCLAKLGQDHAQPELKRLSVEALVTILRKIHQWTTAHLPAEAEEDAGDGSSAGDAPSEAVHEMKVRKSEFGDAVALFHKKPRRGIEELVKQGFCGDGSADAVAKFLLNTTGLQKTSIGEYLGEHSDFTMHVLSSFTQLQSFEGLNLVEAMRAFLATFRLPGEGQKIDRILERFAGKYFADNPTLYATADCVYLLSFSLIMLNTDLHSVKVKHKMSVEDFVKNNRGINAEGDVPKDVLEALYQTIKENPISLREDDDARIKLEASGARAPKKKLELFMRETQSILEKSKEFLKRASTSPEQAVLSIDVTRPLFEIAIWPTLAVFSVLFERDHGRDDEHELLDHCLGGLTACARVACRFDMETERDALISTLAKFSALAQVKKDVLKKKNLDCLKALISVAVNEGGYLGNSWYPVLQCLSQVERLCISGNPESQATTGLRAVVAVKRLFLSNVQLPTQEAGALNPTELSNSYLIAESLDLSDLDLVFSKSGSFPPGSIFQFVAQLCKVSEEELVHPENPRIFTLQKLVEVADFNMGRIRIVWNRLWKIIAAHFVIAIQNKQVQVSMFAVDSLRQLATKFLLKGETANYHFQAEFLKPFETVMVSPATSNEVRELVLSVINSFIVSDVRKNLKSGWISIFKVLALSAEDSLIAEQAFNNLETLFKTDYAICAENHLDFTKTLIAFSKSRASSSNSTRSLSIATTAIYNLADSTRKATDRAPMLQLWLPLLRGLSELGSDSRREIRISSIGLLFDTLRERITDLFDQDTLQLIFRAVVYPLVDDLLHYLEDNAAMFEHGEAPNDPGISPSTAVTVLGHLVRLVDSQFTKVGGLLGDVLQTISSVVDHPVDAVAKAGVTAIKQLVLILIARQAGQDHWTRVCTIVGRLFTQTLPEELMSPASLSLIESGEDVVADLPFSAQKLLTQCTVQLLLVELVEALPLTTLKDDAIWFLITGLEDSLKCSRRFNSMIPLRMKLKQAGFMKNIKQLPGLLKQERETFTTLISLLCKRSLTSTDFRVAEKYRMICDTLAKDYLRKEEQLEALSENQDVEHADLERELSGLAPIISELMLTSFLDIPKDRLRTSFALWIFPLVTDLVMADSPAIRKAVRQILVRKFSPLLTELLGKP